VTRAKTRKKEVTVGAEHRSPTRMRKRKLRKVELKGKKRKERKKKKEQGRPPVKIPRH
jgi:hypothetical protein